jgi:hypothetical protein
MSDLKYAMTTRSMRKQLLTGASYLALAAMFSAPAARASNESAPAIWIELGGQLDRRIEDDIALSPMFVPALEANHTVSPLDVQMPPKFEFGGEGTLSIQPASSNWAFSFSFRYGRSNGTKHEYQQTPLPTARQTPDGTCCFYLQNRISDAAAQYRESQAILDFRAGRDVGLGLLGSEKNSKIAVGIRVAQFEREENLSADAIPGTVVTFPSTGFPLHFAYHRYVTDSHVNRSFRGIGPTINWSGSIPLTSDNEGLDIDWDMGGALLFGRQKSRLSLKTVDNYHENVFFNFVNHPSTHNANYSRSKAALVPNLEASAGISYRFPHARISAGYRVSEFFNAMDVGVGTRKSSNVLLHGPYATVAIGVSPLDL